MAAAPSLVLLVDIGDPAVLQAARRGLQEFGAALCLHPAAARAAAGAAAPPRRPAIVGLTNLATPPGAARPVLQVRYRPGPFVLRDFHAAAGRLAASDAAGAGSGATAAAALQQLVGLVAQDAACAAAGGQRAVTYLTDHAGLDPDDFRPCLEVCRGKGVRVEVVLLLADPDEGGVAGGEQAAAALADGWGAAEAACPHLTVTLVRGASKLSFDALAGSLMQRLVAQPALDVSLQFKHPLVGSIRALALRCTAEVRPLAQAVQHAALCPCHHAPAAAASAAAACTCAISGAPLDRRQCGRDERTVQVGGHPGGALHLLAPFDIGTAGGGGAAAPLSVVARVKADQANPALLFGVPLLLAPAPGRQRAMVALDGDVAELELHQLLGVVCTSLSAAGEALLATCTTDLETGAAGLFRLHYLLLPCRGPGGSAGEPPVLCAKRVACAEELLPPLLEAPPAATRAPAPLPPAVADAVAAQLGRVPLDPLDPLALSARCCNTIDMLVRESQPLPKATVVPAAPVPAPAVAPPPPAAVAPAAPAAALPHAAAAPARGRHAAVAAAAARDSGGRKGTGGRGALAFKRSTRK